MAQGIELGTRDRGQDMWPKMKEDAARIRADLVHALSFMYVTRDESTPWSAPLTRIEKLHGMFPRQYPSRWDDRGVEVKNDNRPYADSPLWLIDSANMYIRETGDCSILAETVKTVRLTNPEFPESSGIVGCETTFSVAEVLLRVLECFRRHADDSPYGMAQIMYGDWCDPIDMFGTSVVGDAATRGKGRGVQTRLSAHLFGSLVATIELFQSQKVRKQTSVNDLAARLAELKQLANRLRKNILRFAWEGGDDAGFISVIHELKKDGSRPDYNAAEIGYTLGSMRGLDFDGAPRRELVSQAYCLNMLLEEREYLDPVENRDVIVQALLKTVDRLMYSDRLGLRLFHPPIANNEVSRRLVGRMGIVPAGCAENGEYHHGQVMMHRFRLPLSGQADVAWKQFRRIVSATRDETLAGPFEMPSTSYASDSADPHFGKGMYFGLSGSTDWIIEVFQAVAGVKLALHDDAQPALKITPHLPEEIGRALTLRRPIHYWTGSGYRRIPLQVQIGSEGAGQRVESMRCLINGQPAASPEVRSLDGVDKLDIAITYVMKK
jgi:cellobiose phosphorylase